MYITLLVIYNKTTTNRLSPHVYHHYHTSLYNEINVYNYMYRYSRLSPILDNSNDRLPLLLKYMYTIIIIIITLFPPGGDNYNHQITNMLTSYQEFIHYK